MNFRISNGAPWTLTGPGYPVYHSLYDDFVWMEKFADPGFRRHVAGAALESSCAICWYWHLLHRATW
jgi:hypothetical protein